MSRKEVLHMISMAGCIGCYIISIGWDVPFLAFPGAILALVSLWFAVHSW